MTQAMAVDRHPDGPLANALADLDERLGLGMSSAQTDALLRFVALLQRWNATYNLTAVREVKQMFTQHLADCLTAVPALRRQLGAAQTPRLLDVGSGGGLPGVVLAVMHESLQVTCVDTVGKKAAFVRQVAVEVGLRNLHSQHARVEQMVAPAPFDVVTSRAFASLLDFTTLTRRHLGHAGVWMAMKGKYPTDEISALHQDVEVFHVEPLTVPGLAAERCLVWMRLRP